MLTVEFNKLAHLNEAKVAMKEAKPLELMLVPVKGATSSPKSEGKGGSLRARKGDAIVREKIDKIEWKPGKEEKQGKQQKKAKKTAGREEVATHTEKEETAEVNGKHDTEESVPKQSIPPALIVEEHFDAIQPAATRSPKRKKHKRKTKSVSGGSSKEQRR